MGLLALIKEVSCLSKDTVSVGCFALTHDLDAELLLTDIRCGRWPPHLADRNSEGEWRMSPNSTLDDVAQFRADNNMWLAGVPAEVSALTLAWSQHQQTLRAEQVGEYVFVPDIAEIVDWCLIAELDAFTATRDQFMHWASYQSANATVTASRWDTLSRWYHLLWESGWTHNKPTRGTNVAVVLSPKVAIK